MISSKTLVQVLCLTLYVVAVDAQSQELKNGGVAPLNKIPSEQWIEKVVGDMDKPGKPFVIRIHHDAGYVVLPHTHPEDELTIKGVLAKPSLLNPGVPTSSSPPDCFKLPIGARIEGERGEGVVVGGLCSPANQFTQYWIKKANGERFWSTLEDLKPQH